ncbi:MAG: archease [Chloroflexi bacterium]|nr:archease [Chloroflexota bacterium]
MSSYPAFEELDHTADLALRVYGRDRAELFAHAALGMFEAMHCHTTEQSAQPIEAEIVLDAPDQETLLVDWLSELLYLSERRRACFTSFDIHQLTETHLEATVHGTTACRPQLLIKAVTYSNLRIKRRDDGIYQVTIIFDI